jgi:3-hydroxyisobutyrate dehydrogenase-like beta-hydroxyacid dehydrogenase
MITGFLHPGQMGASLAAACAGERLWASAGRSAATAARAATAGMADAGDLAAIVARADLIVSICPPDAALEQARRVAALGFGGVYLDANATSPATAREIAALFEHAVDGSVVGPPAERAGTTRLYLSGTDAAAVARRWAGSMVEPRVVGDAPGAASALKMCYAAWTKGSAALVLAIAAAAEADGVAADLAREWALSTPDLTGRLAAAARNAPKAWRFAGEMEEIADTLSASGLPAGFHRAAAEVFRRLSEFKDAAPPAVPDALAAVLDAGPASGTDVTRSRR